jgi:SMI1 / KNR4 family (SUKH-1)
MMDGDWQIIDPPVSEDTLQAAVKRIDFPLPAAFIDFYRLCNGGEGSLPMEPWRFLLWRIEDVADLRYHEHYVKHYAQFAFFGSNGATEYFGIDKNQHVFFMDAVAGEESVVFVANTFGEFVAQLGRRPSKDWK